MKLLLAITAVVLLASCTPGVHHANDRLREVPRLPNMVGTQHGY